LEKRRRKNLHYRRKKAPRNPDAEFHKERVYAEARERTTPAPGEDNFIKTLSRPEKKA